MISIPYGAIKRDYEDYEDEEYAIFQFLMVRLKGFFYNFQNLMYIHFNSLWCD